MKHILEKKNLATKWELLPLVETVAKLSFLSPLEFNGVKDGFIRTGEISHEEIALIIQHTLSFQKVYPEYAPFSEYTKLLLKFFEGLYLPTIWKKLIANKQWTRLTEVALEFRSFQRIKDILQNSLESASHAIGHIHFKEETYNDRLITRLERELLYIDRSPTDGIIVYPFSDVPLFKGKHLFVLGLNEGMFPKQRTLRGYVQERYFENYSSPFPLQMTEYFRKLDDVSFAQLKYVAEKLTFSYVAGMNPHQPLLCIKIYYGRNHYRKFFDHLKVNKRYLPI